ncbi:MAG: phosphomethylpyrimidine synthase ThiC [Clostridiales bacterium]|nr:phosphomethylpyrimidine synthase ThiC [Clostridiales bacterium]
MTYTTQMDAAKKGIITPEMEIVSAKEDIDVELLRERIARGTVVIPANKMHTALSPEGIGEGLKTKINVNLGISKDCTDYSLEMAKVDMAVKMNAEAIMDLSCYGKTHDFRQQLINTCPAMIGTVPMYDAVGYLDKELADITAEEFLSVIEAHAREGVDFMTIHAGINRRTAEIFKAAKKDGGRITNIVSRGGSLIFAWMEMTGNENPWYEFYDEVLDILAKYDVTISLGDACRPGSTHDSTDAAQITELVELGLLTKRAWEKNVQVMIEGPGHMAIDEIAANMKLEKRLCHNAPFYVLGPLVTDIAPGYDHITSAIGGAVAAANGADFLCYVTPAEHLRLPNADDVKEGIVAAKIAAHAGDIAKGIPGARDIDNKMSDARRRVCWEEMFQYAIEPEKPQRYYNELPPEEKHTCSMCGKMCAARTMNKILSGEKVDVQ